MDKLWNASSIFEAGLEIFSTVNINVPWRVCNRKSRDGNIFFGRTPPFVYVVYVITRAPNFYLLVRFAPPISLDPF